MYSCSYRCRWPKIHDNTRYRCIVLFIPHFFFTRSPQIDKKRSSGRNRTLVHEFLTSPRSNPSVFPNKSTTKREVSLSSSFSRLRKLRMPKKHWQTLTCTPDILSSITLRRITMMWRCYERSKLCRLTNKKEIRNKYPKKFWEKSNDWLIYKQ